jgi:hypothetical protein
MKVSILFGLSLLTMNAMAEPRPSEPFQECLNAVACLSHPNVTSYKDKQIECTGNGAVLKEKPHDDVDGYTKTQIMRLLTEQRGLWEKLNDRASDLLNGSTERSLDFRKPIVTSQQLELFAKHFPACSKVDAVATHNFLTTYHSLANFMGIKARPASPPLDEKKLASKPLWESCLEGIVCNAMKGTDVEDTSCDKEGNVHVFLPIPRPGKRLLETDLPPSARVTLPYPGREKTPSRAEQTEAKAIQIIKKVLSEYDVAWTILSENAKQGTFTPEMTQFLVKFDRCEQLAKSLEEDGKPALQTSVVEFKTLRYPEIGAAIAQSETWFQPRLGAVGPTGEAINAKPNHAPDVRVDSGSETNGNTKPNVVQPK